MESETPKIRIVKVDIYQGKDVIKCKGMGPDDPNCLIKNPPEGYEMIAGHTCGGGIEVRGNCAAVFAKREKDPELFILH